MLERERSCHDEVHSMKCRGWYRSFNCGNQRRSICDSLVTPILAIGPRKANESLTMRARESGSTRAVEAAEHAAKLAASGSS